jgi:hypothetical protein
MKTCIDKKIKNQNPLLGLYNAYKERPSNLILEDNNGANILDGIATDYLNRSIHENNFTLLLTLSHERQNQLNEAAIWRDKKWENGKKIRVKFLDGNDFVKTKVISNAVQWTRFANLDFEFVDGDAEVRISFLEEGSWSYIGTDCLSITEQDKPTMNFGWFNDNTPDIEFSRTTLHEFGHAIGLIHEHQSPDANIPWDRTAVYSYYLRTNGWIRDEVDNNIFAIYDNTTITNSDFDRNSIMLYPIDEELTHNRYFVGMNSFLSKKDIEYVRLWYPGR